MGDMRLAQGKQRVSDRPRIRDGAGWTRRRRSERIDWRRLHRRVPFMLRCNWWREGDEAGNDANHAQ
jgi:hypothetical protein